MPSAHLAIDHTAEEALSKLGGQFGALFHTQDFLEGRGGRPKAGLPGKISANQKTGYKDCRDEVSLQSDRCCAERMAICEF
jgi:hypothetical protein